ncbi:hypothetical protein J3Q64DRAFT_1701004 [Phycomyces blakesleeanus]
MGPVEKDRYYEMAKENFVTLHQESSVLEVNLGAKSILTIMNTIKLSVNYNNLFLFWESGTSYCQDIGRLFLLKLLGNVERRPTTIAANEYRNKINKRLITLFNEETEELRKAFPWKIVKEHKDIIRVVRWPEKMPFKPLSSIKDIEKEILVDSLDKGLISFYYYLEGLA